MYVEVYIPFPLASKPILLVPSIYLSILWFQTWCIDSLTYYAEQKVSGRKLPSAFSNVIDDPNQMGGDFVLDNSGKVVLMHLSKTPRDRPTIPDLLKMVTA